MPMSESDRVEQLLSALKDDNEGLRNHAAAGLGQMGESALSRLLDMFLDDDLVIREAATSAVVQIGEPAVLPLIEALTDDEWAIREQAASALGNASLTGDVGYHLGGLNWALDFDNQAQALAITNLGLGNSTTTFTRTPALTRTSPVLASTCTALSSPSAAW